MIPIGRASAAEALILPLPVLSSLLELARSRSARTINLNGAVVVLLLLSTLLYSITRSFTAMSSVATCVVVVVRY